MNTMKKFRLTLASLFVAVGLMLGLSAVTASAATYSYSKVSYESRLSLPIADHVWRVQIPNLAKADPSSVSVVTNNKKSATVTFYAGLVKTGCIYVNPLKNGKSTISISFDAGSKSYSYRIALSVFGYVNPIKILRVGPRDHADKLEDTNHAHDVLLCSSKAMVKVITRPGWELKAIYAQGMLKKTGKTVAKKITNRKVFNFGAFYGKPDILVRVYNAKRKMTLMLQLTA